MNNNGIILGNFHESFVQQQIYQEQLIGIKTPCDNIDWFSYHIQAMVEELGELMKSDKRWKNVRNTKYDKDEKLEELADCFITLINVSMFSGFNSYDIQEAIYNKIKKNQKR